MVAVGIALETDDREGLFAALLRAASDLTDADHVALYAVAGAGLEIRAATDPELVGRRIAADELPAGLYGVLTAQGRELGTLVALGDPARFDAAAAHDLAALARQAGAALDTMRLHEEAKRLSLTDGLTGLWNRRQLDLRVSQELERAARFGERFSIVLIDLDDFKAVNDTHGHPVGDAVLVEVAQRLVTHTREVDVVARFGGEEFVLLLPQTDLEGACRVADKVRDEVAAVPVETDGLSLSISLSAGVACHPRHGATAAALLAAADEALYRAKHTGKNRVQAAAG
jgi:diguanylate cyclase (GGDEF)-like protein